MKPTAWYHPALDTIGILTDLGDGWLLEYSWARGTAMHCKEGRIDLTDWVKLGSL